MTALDEGTTGSTNIISRKREKFVFFLKMSTLKLPNFVSIAKETLREGKEFRIKR